MTKNIEEIMNGWNHVIMMELEGGDEARFVFDSMDEMKGFEQGVKMGVTNADRMLKITLYEQPSPPPPRVIRIADISTMKKEMKKARKEAEDGRSETD